MSLQLKKRTELKSIKYGEKMEDKRTIQTFLKWKGCKLKGCENGFCTTTPAQSTKKGKTFNPSPNSFVYGDCECCAKKWKKGVVALPTLKLQPSNRRRILVGKCKMPLHFWIRRFRLVNFCRMANLRSLMRGIYLSVKVDHLLYQLYEGKKMSF